VEKAAKQIAARQSIDNRLHVSARVRRLPDAQLEKDINDKLGDELSPNVQVRAQNGTVTLQGQLDNWQQVADAIDAAFAAGATQVNSQFAVAGAGAMAQGGAAGGAYPSYGYTPGPQGQLPYAPRGRQGAMGGQGQASSADLRLARQVADQLRQELPQGQNVQPIQPQSIYVMVRQGTVTLHGYVQSSSQKQQAAQIVQPIQGVQNVRNDLTILSTRGTAGQAGGQMGSQEGFGGTSSQSEAQQGYGGTGSQSRSPSSSDRRLAQTIQQQIQNQFPDANINVTASQGTITLRGTVQDDNEKQEAEQIAQSVTGAQNVQNNLRVSSQGGSFQPQGYIPGQSSQSQQGMSSPDQSSGQSSSQQGFGGQDQYSQSGQAGAPMGGRQAGMSASDMALAQKVAQQLKQQLSGVQNIQIMRPGTIYVMAASGNIMLYGIVANPNVKQQVNQIARAVPGVQNVTDRLWVAGAAAGTYPSYGYIPGQGAQTQYVAENRQSTSGQSDMAIAQRVALKLRQQLPSFYNVQIATPGTIYVKVSNGAVTLDGFVSNNDARRNAEQIAKSISGVQNVKNSLSIVGINQTLGYTPGDEDQSANQNQESGDPQSYDQSEADQTDNEIN
jgi:osmotically-inducible protein OsmY